MINKFVLILLSLIPNAYVIGAWLGIDIFTQSLIILILLITIFESIRFIDNIKVKYMDVFIYALFIYMLVTTLLLDNPINGLLKISNLFVAGIFVIYICRFFIKNIEDLDFLFKSLLLTSIFMNFIIMFNFISLGMPVGRFSFYGTHPIPLAMLAGIALLISIILYIKKKMRLIYLVMCLVSSMFVLIISSSKGPFIAMLLTLVILVPYILSRIRIALITGVIILVSHLILSNLSHYEAFILRIINTTEDQSTRIRLSIFEEAENIFLNNPIVGAGVGYYSDYYPHNIFLEIIAEGGIVLLLFLMVFLMWVVVKYVKGFSLHRHNSYYIVPLGMLIMSIIVLSVSYTYIDMKFMYLAIGILVSYTTIENKENNKSIKLIC